MPTYSYACTECGNEFDIQQSFSEDSLTVCPSCQGRLRKVFSAVGVVFKGSGFYRTDSRSSNNGGSSTSATSGDAGKGSSAEGSGGSDGATSDAKPGATDSKPAADAKPAAAGKPNTSGSGTGSSTSTVSTPAA